MEEYLRNSHNILLLKDDLGKAKPSSYPLPGAGFAFGKVIGNDAEGAKEGNQKSFITYITQLLAAGVSISQARPTL
jgi:Domain of unknown function (DUF4483)